MDKEQEQALATLNTNPFTSQLKDLKDATLAGWVNPIDASIALRKLKDLVVKIEKDLKECTMEELDSYPTGFENGDVLINKKNAPGRWDYQDIEEHAALKKKIKEVEEKAKLAYKAHKAGDSLVTKDGEITKMAHYQEGSETLVFKFKFNK